jgi:hypothetical protein
LRSHREKKVWKNEKLGDWEIRISPLFSCSHVPLFHILVLVLVPVLVPRSRSSSRSYWIIIRSEMVLYGVLNTQW